VQEARARMAGYGGNPVYDKFEVVGWMVARCKTCSTLVRGNCADLGRHFKRYHEPGAQDGTTLRRRPPQLRNLPRRRARARHVPPAAMLATAGQPFGGAAGVPMQYVHAPGSAMAAGGTTSGGHPVTYVVHNAQPQPAVAGPGAPHMATHVPQPVPQPVPVSVPVSAPTQAQAPFVVPSAGASNAGTAPTPTPAAAAAPDAGPRVVVPAPSTAPAAAQATPSAASVPMMQPVATTQPIAVTQPVPVAQPVRAPQLVPAPLVPAPQPVPSTQGPSVGGIATPQAVLGTNKMGSADSVHPTLPEATASPPSLPVAAPATSVGSTNAPTGPCLLPMTHGSGAVPSQESAAAASSPTA